MAGLPFERKLDIFLCVKFFFQMSHSVHYGIQVHKALVNSAFSNSNVTV